MVAAGEGGYTGSGPWRGSLGQPASRRGRLRGGQRLPRQAAQARDALPRAGGPSQSGGSGDPTRPGQAGDRGRQPGIPRGQPLARSALLLGIQLQGRRVHRQRSPGADPAIDLFAGGAAEPPAAVAHRSGLLRCGHRDKLSAPSTENLSHCARSHNHRRQQRPHPRTAQSDG